MDITTLARLRRINIRVRIHPNHRHLPPKALFYRARGPSNGANGDGVVAAKGEDEAAVAGVRVDLFGELAGYG